MTPATGTGQPGVVPRVRCPETLSGTDGIGGGYVRARGTEPGEHELIAITDLEPYLRDSGMPD